MELYVFTGGPGFGKSSLILELEFRNEYVIREGAEDHIRRMQAKGISQPWLMESFQADILALQEKREARMHPKAQRYWLDRGGPDGLAYQQKNGKPAFPELVNSIKNCNFTGIFLIQSLGTIERADYRREDLEEAILLENLQRQNYTDMGYNVINVGPGSVDERVNFILQTVKDAKAGKLSFVMSNASPYISAH